MAALGGAWLMAATVFAQAPTILPAFPVAEGFGASAKGGRGGQVLAVTNLHDAGPGSLRAALETPGPRTVVFRVGGTIELRSELVITHPFLTIAGQTAPGGGITLKCHPANPRSALTLKGGVHDVIIRHLRIRPGPPTRREDPNDDSHIQDALQILDASRVIVDHCSFSWATDEVVSTFASAQDVTLQWCLIAEALRNTGRGGPDGKGLLLGGAKAQRVSAHHNLLAHNIGRNPLIKMPGPVDVVDNVVLAPATIAMAVDGEHGRTAVNLVGNHVLAPHGDGLVYGVRVLGRNPVSLFLADNRGPLRTKATEPEHLFVRPANQAREYLTPRRHDTPPITVLPPDQVVDQVLRQAGCLRPARDAVDKRILQEVRQTHTRLLTDPAEVGGWPNLDPGTAPADTDADGMPDLWEQEHQLDRANPADGPADADADGYTNLEEYLNDTHPRRRTRDTQKRPAPTTP